MGKAGGAALIAVLFGLSGCQGAPAPIPERQDQSSALESPVTSRSPTQDRQELQAALEASRVALRSGQPEHAAATLASLLDRHRRCAELHRLYQDVSRKAGGETEARMRAYYQSLRDMPGCPIKPYALARLAPHEAACKERLEEALRRDPGFQPACLEMAAMRRKIGQPTVALRFLKQALEMDGDCLEGHRAIAGTYMELSNWRAAEQHLKRVLQAEPADLRALRDLAWLQTYKLDKPRQAVKLVDALIRLEPEDTDRWMDRAAIHWKMREFDAAAGWYRKVLRKQPAAVRAALSLGDLHYARGERQRAAAKRKPYWRKARQAYRYLLAQPEAGSGLMVLNNKLAVPARLRKIRNLLGPLPASAPVPTLADF